MDNIDFGDLNYLAVLVAVVFNQVLGAAWYGALSRPWMAETGMTQEDIDAMKGTSRQWVPYVVAIVLAIVFTLGLALLVQGMGADNAGEGLGLGVLAAVGFVLTSHGVNYAFEGRSLKLLAINVGYPLISYALIGLLLAVWD
ncbi:MAG: DUF1761 domain-containing protein [Acidimicrobiia bacterium]|nr:DUF1761 domain-containing protein [bacterium]MXW57910.1 DUF1761 domain-containing protein [Acidimicrobiia bacterium]MDE0580581.1 DUF1761 domain-containing protein [bacterium]MDE0614280.1 DUF1761 domain-containing protein [bacterium]MXZ79617.1 DUF1761 domain-containing protein [Acidimicrobiia bacterium]